MAPLIRFLRLPPREKGLHLKAYGLVCVLRATLPFISPTTIVRWARADRERGRAVRGGPGPSAIGSAVMRVSRFVPGATCLSQSLATKILLAHRGFDSSLKIGVDAAADRLQAHAWVECDGEVVIGETSRRYHQLLSLGQREEGRGR